MAAAVITEIAEELQCPICLEEFTKPKVLDCKHVFCCRCLVMWIKKKTLLTCPVCKTEQKLTRGEKIEDLPEPLVLTKLQQAVTRFMTASLAISADRTCDLCPPNKIAGYFCHNCSKNMCEQCEQKHSSKKAFKNHKIIRLSKHTICYEHKGELKTLYCQDCQLGICNVCFYTAHENHNATDAQEVIATKTEKLQLFIKSTEKIRKQIVYQESALKTEENKLQANYRSAEKELKEVRRKVNDIIDQAERKLQLKLHAEMKKMLFYKTDVEDAKATQENLLKYINDKLDKGCHLDIVSAADDIPSMSTNVSLVLPKVVTPSVRGEELLSLCQSLVHYNGSLDPGERSVVVSDTHRAASNAPTLIPREPSTLGTPCNKLWEKKIDYISGDISYNKKTGDLWINTDLKTEHLCRYNLQGQHMPKVPVGTQVYYFTMDTKRDVFLTTVATVYAIATISKSGELIRQVAIGGATDLWGIVYIPETDMIAVCDHENHCVWFVDAGNMKVVKQIGSAGRGDEEFDEPCYVCYHAGAGFPSPVIVVGDCNNDCVKVLDMNGQFVRRYGSYGSGDRQLMSPMGVGVDKKGRILVADYGNRRVVRFWHSGGREQWDVVVNTHQLRGLYPRGVCVTDKGHLAIITRTIDDRHDPIPPSHILLFTYQ